MALLSLFQAVSICIALVAGYFVRREVTVARPRRAFSRKHGCLPAKRHPSRDPIFALDVLNAEWKAVKEHRMLEAMQNAFANLGRTTFGYNALGQHMFHTCDSENTKAILATNFSAWSFGATRNDLRDLLGEGIFTTDGTAWQHSRELLRPNLVRSQVADLVMMEAHVQRLISLVPSDGTTCDLAPLFLRLSMDVATDFLFGESTDTLEPGAGRSKGQQFAALFAEVTGGLVDLDGGLVWLLLKSFLFRGERRRKGKLLREHAGSIVEEALAKPDAKTDEKAADGRYVFLHELVKQTSDPDKIQSELLNILVAGRDTTAGLLTNVWFLLARHRRVHARLTEEIAAHVSPGEPPTYEQINAMKYLRAVLNEALRLYPIVPANTREALMDTVLPRGGVPDGESPIFVAKGQVVSYWVWAMHRREDLYGDDADQFRPERWLDEDGRKGIRPGWDFLPFNGGPRICIGQQFAMMEASYVTIRLMQEFPQLESRDTEPWREYLTITCSSLNGCKVALMAQD